VTSHDSVGDGRIVILPAQSYGARHRVELDPALVDISRQVREGR
jgi:hypothetical protein